MKTLHNLTSLMHARKFLLIVLLFCLGFSFLVSCQKNPETKRVIIVCEECKELNIPIDLWDAPEQNESVGQVAHNTKGIVLQKRSYNGVMFYRVRAGGYTGWISRGFIER
jgi:hypothetical protein